MKENICIEQRLFAILGNEIDANPIYVEKILSEKEFKKSLRNRIIGEATGVLVGAALFSGAQYFKHKDAEDPILKKNLISLSYYAAGASAALGAGRIRSYIVHRDDSKNGYVQACWKLEEQFSEMVGNLQKLKKYDKK